MKVLTVNGTEVLVERSGKGWLYSFRTPPDPKSYPAGDGVVLFGPTRGKGWAPTLRDVRAYVTDVVQGQAGVG